jgi:hypothetical protein
MRRGTTFFGRAAPVPSARRRLPSQQLTARDEALFNAIRQATWRLVTSSASTTPNDGSVARNRTWISLHALHDALPDDVHSDLRARRTTLLETLERCPKWFSCNEAAAGTLGLTDDAMALRETHADVTMDHLALPIPRSEDDDDGQVRATSVKIAWAGMTPVFMDVSKPILTAAEIEASRLPRLVATTMIPFGPDVPADVIAQKRTLLDESIHDAIIFPPELTAFDELYRRKGFLAPSHVLHVMLEYVPSFFVELSKVFDALPPKVRLQFYDHIGMDRHGRYKSLTRPFQDYPMLFEVEVGSFRKSLVKLNFNFPFVAQHPRFGAADRSMRQYSREFARERGVVSRDTVRFQYAATAAPSLLPSSSAMAPGSELVNIPRHLRLTKTSDLQIFQVLLSHLPRAPTVTDPAVGLYSFTPLVAWVNSFPEFDLDLLNEVPQERVLTLLTRYRRIFQLSTIDGADPNLYSPWSENPWRTAAHETAQPTAVIEAGNEEADRSDDALDVDAPSPPPAAGKKRPPPAPELDEATQARVTTFKSALADELLGLDDLLAEGGLKETFDRGDDLDDDLAASEAPTGTRSENMDNCDATDEPPGKIDWEADSSLSPDGADNAPHDEERVSRNDGVLPSLVDVQPSETLPRSFDSDGQGNRGRQERESSAYVPSSFDFLCVRRLPPSVAPGSLSDLDQSSTPDEVLLKHVLGFLTPPPPPVAVGKEEDYSALHKWRWVQIETIYRKIPPEQRFRMKPFRGLPNFMRLHGRLLEVSLDVSYVILHDATRVPPLIPSQRSFTLEERMSIPATFDSRAHETGNTAVAAVLKHDAERRATFRSVLKDSQVPTNRQQLRFLDPGNPLLDGRYLAEEIAAFLPHHPVPMMQMMSRLPPIMKAAIPASGMMKFFAKYPNLLHVAYDPVQGKTLIKRVGSSNPNDATGGAEGSSQMTLPAASVVGSNDASAVWSLTKTLQHLDEVIEGAGRRGISPAKLVRVLPRPAVKAIQREFSTAKMDEFLELYPERFEIFHIDDAVFVRKAS